MLPEQTTTKRLHIATTFQKYFRAHASPFKPMKALSTSFVTVLSGVPCQKQERRTSFLTVLNGVPCQIERGA